MFNYIKYQLELNVRTSNSLLFNNNDENGKGIIIICGPVLIIIHDKAVHKVQ